MKSKKVSDAFLLFVCMLIMLTTVIFMSVNNVSAEEVTNVYSVQDLIGTPENNNKQTDNSSSQNEVINNNSEDTVKNSDTLTNYNSLQGTAKIDINNEKALKAVEPVKNVVGIVVTFLCYVIVIMLTFRSVVDILYIAIPFIRKFLAPQAQTGGMAQGGLNGAGMNMGGAGGFGNMSSGYSMPSSTGTQGGALSGRNIASEDAIYAVSQEGTGANVWSVYMKKMLWLFIVTPILLVLATNGALITLGFKLAGVITSVLSKINGSI